MSAGHGGPAFPIAFPDSDRDNHYVAYGMTLRDHFAGLAMQGLLANPKLAEEIRKQGGAFSGWIESSSYGWADAMLKEREQ